AGDVPARSDAPDPEAAAKNARGSWRCACRGGCRASRAGTLRPVISALPRVVWADRETHHSEPPSAKRRAQRETAAVAWCRGLFPRIPGEARSVSLAGPRCRRAAPLSRAYLLHDDGWRVGRRLCLRCGGKRTKEQQRENALSSNEGFLSRRLFFLLRESGAAPCFSLVFFSGFEV
ncbi:hypothetical protein TcCL_ESM10626, partial [Trypanosoma cruzi]